MTVSINGVERTRPELSTHDTALSAVQADLGDPSARTNLQTILALLGNPDVAGKSLYDNLGDFVGLSNFASLLALLGIPDVSGKSLYTVLVTDLLSHGTHGLAQLRTDINAIPTTMVGTNNAALATVLEDAMQKATGPAYNQDTDSQEALRELLDTMVTAIAALQTDLDNPAQYKANVAALALEATLTAIKGGGWSTETLVVIKTAIDAIPTTMVGTNNAALASAWTAALATALGNYTAVRAGYLDELDFDLQGLLNTIAAYLTTEIADILTDTGTTIPGLLSTIQTDLDNPSQYMANLSTLETRLSSARAGYLDELASANLPADIAALATSQGRQLFTMDFWSDTQEELLINATAANKTLPTVTVVELPAGATILRAIAMFKFRMVENVYAGANAINVAQHIQVRDDTPGTWRDAISIADNFFNFSEAAREGGDVLIGDHDIAVEVDADDGYNFQWTLADADQVSINFNDVQVGLRIWYSV